MRSYISATRRAALVLVLALAGTFTFLATPATAVPTDPSADQALRAHALAAALGYAPSDEEITGAVEILPAERSGILDSKLAADPRYEKGITVATVNTTTVTDNPSLLAQLKAEDVVITGCFYVARNQYGLNSVGNRIWRFTLGIDWCYNGYQVTSISPPQISGYVYSWASALGWEYDGITSQAQWDYYGDKWVYRSTANGKFSFCPPPKLWCLQRVYPWITMDNYANGDYDMWSGV